ncbi:FmdB family zinc ribbon protein [Parendozoicomonas haliclonae]|uniref:Zinc ribbon domain protein n=1 Tax=Parendozoicomonas haliclonae TaxID=1960125 RepID=A0A1X7AHL9_9GAMM|nr:zinc ribbon domain-containing protein [Parendozoicomonas haliclonae]SMA36405.1 Zinc ribbon domain protein [Parendozoicomonas haliclonae]
MPIYEYLCQDCGTSLEAIQKFSDAPLTDCPECGKPELKKLLSAPAFRLKGGGWYETDFKGGKTKNVSTSDNHCPNKSNNKSGCGSCAATSD